MELGWEVWKGFSIEGVGIEGMLEEVLVDDGGTG